MVDKDNVLEFLKDIADAIKTFELPQSDFPLHLAGHFASGYRICTVDGRHVASIRVEGDCSGPSCPTGPATMAYQDMFVELANAYMKFNNRSKENAT